MSYPDIEAFLAVAREGQLARAAEQLGTSVTTLHRRIATLEAAIGTGLFVRSSGGHRLSEAGERLLASANGVEAAMGGFRRAAAAVRTTPEGKVRIAAPEMIVLHLLAPRVAALREAAPRIVPEFMSSPDRARLAERQADMAVRLSDPGEASLVARRTGSIRFGLYAPDAAVAVQQAERTADGWLPVSWVGWNDALTGLPVARCSAGLLPPELQAGAANALSQQLELARALGAAIVLPDFIARREADLRRVAAAPSPLLELPLWLVVNQEVRGLPAMEAVAHWIRLCLSELR